MIVSSNVEWSFVCTDGLLNLCLYTPISTVACSRILLYISPEDTDDNPYSDYCQKKKVIQADMRKWSKYIVVEVSQVLHERRLR